MRMENRRNNVKTGVKKSKAGAIPDAECVLIRELVKSLGKEMVGFMTLCDHSAISDRVLAHGAECAQCAEILSAGQDLWMKNRPEAVPPDAFVDEVRAVIEAQIQCRRTPP